MSFFCDQCGKQLDPRMDRCPACGAPNRYYAPRTPRTVDELRQFAAGQGLPLDQMRFFLGIDTKQPRAFGIYRDTDGLFVVYKNKSDGSRAVRYHGPDEAHAVNELYQKMLAEMQIQREAGTARPAANYVDASRVPEAPRKRGGTTLLAVLAMAVIVAAVLFFWYRSTGSYDTPTSGYYLVDDVYYYSYLGDWYYYDDGYWYSYDGYIDDYDDYYVGYYSDSYGVSDLYGSSWYDNYSSSNNSYDDSYDDSYSSWDDDSSWDSYDSYDYSDWDSGYSDWDSDWR